MIIILPLAVISKVCGASSALRSDHMSQIVPGRGAAAALHNKIPRYIPSIVGVLKYLST